MQHVAETPISYPGFVESEQISSIRSTATRLASTSLPILISGEVGTGRRTLARALTNARSAGTYKELHPASSPDKDLIEISKEKVHTLILNFDDFSEGHRQLIAKAHRSARFPLIATMHSAALRQTTEIQEIFGSTHLALPPLSQRPTDIPKWFQLFASEAPSSEVAAALRNWKGNLLQLKNTIERAHALFSSPFNWLELLADESNSPIDRQETITIEPLQEAIAAFRLARINQAMTACGGNRTEAAKMLGISRRQLVRHLNSGV